MSQSSTAVSSKTPIGLVPLIAGGQVRQPASATNPSRIDSDASDGKWIFLPDGRGENQLVVPKLLRVSSGLNIDQFTKPTSALDEKSSDKRGSELSKQDSNTSQLKNVSRHVLATISGRLNARGLRLRQYPVTLHYRLSESSTAGGGINATFGVQPASSGEWSSLKTLFDEVKVVSGSVSYQLAMTTAGSTTPQALAVVSYDPIDSTVYASSVGALSASQKAFTMLNPNGASVFPLSETSRGFWTMHFKVPSGSARSLTTSTSMGRNDWADTADSADCWGYIKPYVDAVGGTGVITLVAYVHMNCVFRSRT